MLMLEDIGVTSAKITQFKRRKLKTVEDLLRYYPTKYKDFREKTLISELQRFEKKSVMISGVVIEKKLLKGTDLKLLVKDKTGVCTVYFYHQAWRLTKVNLNQEYVIGGVVQANKYTFAYEATFANPEVFCTVQEGADKAGIVPVYKKITGMADEYLRSTMVNAENEITSVILDELTSYERKALNVCTEQEMLKYTHFPTSPEEIEIARRRQVVDELYPFCQELKMKQESAKKKSAASITRIEVVKQIQELLPFELTEDQMNAITNILNKMMKKNRVDVLIQGDVGCGKTVVAEILSAVIAKNGFQVAVMAPTAVLAEQHYNDFDSLLSKVGVRTVLLTSATSVKDKKIIAEQIEKGEADVIIGTHAIFNKYITYNKLGLTIVDEEHRFGVAQREALRQKAADGIHHIGMSATPIPRTIATSLYGELTEIINIKTMPNGRKPVKTIYYNNELKVCASMFRQIRQGRQCYVICPLIEESDSDLMAGVDSVEKTLETMKKIFDGKQGQNGPVRVEAISSNMKSNDIQTILDEFTKGNIDILISTTIVEVGVNVPNASVILVKNAERFGLAQLHQLRGRVGRGQYESYCVLLSEDDENERIKTMVETTDGFKIAEKDFELRGAGQLLGLKQSGTDKYLNLMMENRVLFDEIMKLPIRHSAVRNTEVA